MVKDTTKEDLAFLRNTPPQEFAPYCGEWIAVVGGGIVAHGRDPASVYREALKAGKGAPFMEYIYNSKYEVPFFSS